jgi:hypothetical protein
MLDEISLTDLRLPTIALPAEIRYFDERLLSGRIYLPARAQRHDGPMRPDEWMNQRSVFFPFMPDGDQHPVILNKRYVVVLSLTDGAGHLEMPEEVGVCRHVEVQCGSLRMEGLVYIDLPENQSRLLDWVNRPEPFLMLHEGKTNHMIQKSRITFLSEPLEEDAL